VTHAVPAGSREATVACNYVSERTLLRNMLNKFDIPMTPVMQIKMLLISFLTLSIVCEELLKCLKNHNISKNGSVDHRSKIVQSIGPHRDLVHFLFTMVRNKDTRHRENLKSH
jgi:hypothetical protein